MILLPSGPPPTSFRNIHFRLSICFETSLPPPSHHIDAVTPSSEATATLSIRRSRCHSFIDHHRNSKPNRTPSTNLPQPSPSYMPPPSQNRHPSLSGNRNTRGFRVIPLAASSAHIHHANKSTTNVNSIHPKKRHHLEIVCFLILFSSLVHFSDTTISKFLNRTGMGGSYKTFTNEWRGEEVGDGP